MSRFTRGFPRVALGNSAGSRHCCVMSPGSRVGITELMLGLRCNESVVTLLVLRCHGFGTVLDFFRWLVSRRESSGPASRSTLRALEGEARVQEHKKRERESADAPQSFELSGFGHRPLAAGRIRVSVWCRALPMSMGHTLITLSCDEKLTFTHVLKLLPGLPIYNITTFVILLIHTFLQPFIQV